jgi:hypothetical protein
MKRNTTAGREGDISSAVIPTTHGTSFHGLSIKEKNVGLQI